MTPDDCIKAAHNLAPLIREKAREAEVARRPLDEVIDAVRESGLFSMMVPKRYGGYELDVDTYFEVVLILSEADTSMGWLIGFYIEHAYWLAEYPDHVQDEIYGDDNHVLAPVALNLAGGTATPDEGGYRLTGRWAWGTGIVHATWVIAGSMATNAEGKVAPVMFVLPIADVEPVDTWHISGMCATGSMDFEINDAFVPNDRVLPFVDLVGGGLGTAERYGSPLYSTPLLPILGLAAGVPLLGAARGARASYCEQVKAKIEAAGKVKDDRGFGRIGEASLTIDAAELLMRDVLASIMSRRSDATREERSEWQNRISHAVSMCRDATNEINASLGASGAMLDNPVQRFARDINTASNHRVFERDVRHADHTRQLLGQPIQSILV